MTVLVADLGGLSALVDRIASVEAALCERVGELDANAARVGSCWTGAAAESYAAAHRAWSGDAQQMRGALGALRCVVSTAHENYTAACAANRAMWP